jgi:hypothetical protein
MSRCDITRGRKLFAAILVATALIGSALPGSKFALAAGGACALVPSERDPSEKILQCGQELTVRPAHGTSYRPIYKTGQQLPAAVRLDNGALLIEFHPDGQQIEFQILTPLAVAAVRGTKWAMEVSAVRTSTLVLEGAVAVTSRRQSVRHSNRGAGRRHLGRRRVADEETMGGSQGSRSPVALRRVDAI